ncbi:hypothetical protein Glove_680g57 [Diversispora epigaea]|uniref:Uncharacterized protein n=1 Tax=Diversispora epigaea TaxID=1348612 RepID=A0A397G5Q0_9GLOM|nr:hypothetical protein Glove_680g57 [Diversispora epigaea]
MKSLEFVQYPIKKLIEELISLNTNNNNNNTENNEDKNNIFIDNKNVNNKINGSTESYSSGSGKGKAGRKL